MPDVKRLQKLIERLTMMSESNNVPWAETSEERTFQASLQQFTVTVELEHVGQNWGEDIYRYVVRIHDNVGKLLDEVTERDFPDNSSFAGGTKAHDALKNLYDLARRKALKVDEQLDNLLASLDR